MDDKSKTGGADRRQVAKTQQYEVGYFARKHRISAADARWGAASTSHVQEVERNEAQF